MRFAPLFFKKMKTIIESEQFTRTLRRIAHEIIEKNEDLSKIVLVGILNKGLPIALEFKRIIEELEGIEIPVESINIQKHRDDDKKNSQVELNFNHDVTGKTVILVDDVLFTGRSVRAAMDAIMDFGRPAKIELAIVVDRGHRELPIRADFVGKNIPTAISEKVIVDFENRIIQIM